MAKKVILTGLTIHDGLSTRCKLDAATITVTDTSNGHEISTTTDANGDITPLASWGGNEDATLRLKVSKNGYYPFKADVTVTWADNGGDRWGTPAVSRIHLTPDQ